MLWQGERFLTGDPRFRVAHEDESPDAVVVQGARNARQADLLRVFVSDRGHSLYELDPAKKRLQLRTVDWVRDASVRRVWPNRVAVEVVEREPVAFIQAPSAATGSFDNPVTYQPKLIDADGVVLPLRGEPPRDLPLLVGIRPDEDVEARRVRVQRLLKLMAAVAEHRANVLEVDVSNIRNLRLTYQIGGRQVILAMGDEQFRERLELFLRKWETARESVQPGDILDLTFEGRIVVKRARPGA
jgi:cell division protein FtsQ